MFQGNPFDCLLKLATDSPGVSHEILIGSTRNNIRIENRGGNLETRGHFHRHPSRITTQSQHSSRLVILKNLAEQILGFSPAFPKSEQSTDAGFGRDDGLRNE